jgi:alpha-beta hydrolase superfamily lysophospholipase
MSSSTFRLETSDGAPVHVRRWEPTGTVRGVVQLVHGLGEHGGRYTRLAAALTAAGWAVYADDHRGHGQSVARPEDRGHVPARGWALLLDDVTRLTRRARADHPGVPLVQLGHSMGANLVLQSLATAPGQVDAAVLTSPASPPGASVALLTGLVRLERLRLGERGRSALLERLVFGTFNRPFRPVRTSLDWAMRRRRDRGRARRSDGVLSLDQPAVGREPAGPLGGDATASPRGDRARPAHARARRHGRSRR